MKFTYKAKNPDGTVQEGVVEADTRDAASLLLQKNGLMPVAIREDSQTSAISKDFARIWERVSVKDLVAFFRQLGVLIEAKVPVTASLIAIAEETENSYFRIILKEVKEDVDDGMALSDAFGKHSDVFSPFVVNLVHAGEVSGGLQRSIAFIADNLEKDYHLVSKIKGALYYPAFVLFAAFIIGFLVVTFIVPRITSVLKDFEGQLPWYTQAIIATSDFLSAYWWVVLIVIFGGIASFLYYIRTPDGRRAWEEQLLSLPVVGRIAQYIYVARLTENLGVLLNGGIPVVRALTIVSSVVGNESFKRIILLAAEEVKSGGNMSSVFLRSKEIPHLVSQMTKIGEESGTLSSILQSVSSFYSQEVDSMTRNLTALLEPMLIVVLGIGVAILVVGILLPIYNVVGNMAM